MRPLIRAVMLLLAVCVRWIAPAAADEPPPWEAAPREGTGVTPAMTKFWYAKHEAFLKQAAAQHYQIVFFGDSNTQGWIIHGMDTWNRLFVPLGALNLGIGGDSTQNALWRIAHGELDGLAPKLTVLLIGASDLIVPRDRGLWTAPELVRGIVAVATAIRQKLPETHLVVLALLPAGRLPNQPIRRKVEEVDALLEHEDFGPRARLMNIGPHLVQPDGEEKPELYQPDGLHLSGAGYAVEGELLEPVVKALVAP